MEKIVYLLWAHFKLFLDFNAVGKRLLACCFRLTGEDYKMGRKVPREAISDREISDCGYE